MSSCYDAPVGYRQICYAIQNLDCKSYGSGSYYGSRYWNEEQLIILNAVIGGVAFFLLVVLLIIAVVIHCGFNRVVREIRQQRPMQHYPAPPAQVLLQAQPHAAYQHPVNFGSPATTTATS